MSNEPHRTPRRTRHAQRPLAYALIVAATAALFGAGVIGLWRLG